jgi:hypothetical protein
MRTLWMLALAGCGGTLVLTPERADLGTVDFNRPRPDAGYAALPIEILNDGGRDVTAILTGIDADRITVEARLQSPEPPTLPTLGSGDTLVLTVGAFDYEAGELDTEVSGAFRLVSDDLSDDVIIPWSFTPIRSADGG